MAKELEQKPEEEQGWTDIWQAQDAKWDAAISQIYGLRTGVYTSSPTDPHGVLVLEGTVTGNVLKYAPPAIRRVFNDLGINFDDRVSIGLSVPPARSFVFGIRPEQITDDKIGLILSSDVGQGAVIAPLHSIKTVSVVHYPFNPEGTSLSGHENFMRRAADTRYMYKYLSENVGGIGLYYGKRHPYMVDIVDSIATWVTFLASAREISIPQSSA